MYTKILFLYVAIISSFASVTVTADNSPHIDVVPYPIEVKIGSGASYIEPKHFRMTSQCEVDCDILDRAIDRYMKIIFKQPGTTNTVFRLSIFENRIKAPLPVGQVNQLVQLNIITTAKERVDLELGVDESYTLYIPGNTDMGNEITLTALTVWGALRGLETFAQLVSYQQSAGEQPTPGFYVQWTPISIQDAPRYSWRGLLVDSGRHYLSKELLERTVDTMAAMKLNVLHWHIVDAESFPYVSSQYTDLQYKSAYHPNASYSKDMISDLISYARDRGVRIVPEFDTPGHTASIGESYPDLIADCYDWLVETYGDDLRWPMFNSVALDVTKDDTKTFVKDIIDEMSRVFPDRFFHIGGDEVNQGCWNAVPSILAWMQTHGYATKDPATQQWTYDFTALQGSWTSYVQEITAGNKKSAIVWEESFTLGFDLSNDTVVHIWLPDTGTNVLQRALESGHRVLLSNGWYVDRQAPTCVDDDICKVNWMWMWSGRDMYRVEPLSPSHSGWKPTEEQAKLILGGEAASWGESVDDKNFDVRVWSRTPGIAERLWSASTKNDPWELQPRISALACNLARRGVSIADSQPAFCDYYKSL